MSDVWPAHDEYVVEGIAMHHATDCAPIQEVVAACGFTGRVRWFHEDFGGFSKAPVIVADAAMAVASEAATNVETSS